jgi:FKBP-type peptidyl-prolyl cis-trans isomerase SlyD
MGRSALSVPEPFRAGHRRPKRHPHGPQAQPAVVCTARPIRRSELRRKSTSATHEGYCFFALPNFTLAPSNQDFRMQIAQDAVASIHYTLTDESGNKLDASDGTPLAYLHGNGNLIPGLERELEGKSAGDKLKVKIAAADAYGEYDKSLVQRVPRRALKGVGDLRVGTQLHTQSAHGVRAVTVTQIVGDMVTIDANHPLAGQTLNFEVEIAEVRAATQEELAHGHVHGPGGHHDH